jgi:hypothetical protein
MAYWNGTRWAPDAAATPSRRQIRVPRLVSAAAEASLIVVLAFGLIAGSAHAARGGGGKGGGSSSGSVSPVMVADANGNGSPNWNDQVSFEVVTTATDKPWVRLDCYRDGKWVSTAVHGFFPEYPWNPHYTLASGAWTSGAATCVAELYSVAPNGRNKTLATTTFAVAD